MYNNNNNYHFSHWLDSFKRKLTDYDFDLPNLHKIMTLLEQYTLQETKWTIIKYKLYSNLPIYGGDCYKLNIKHFITVFCKIFLKKISNTFCFLIKKNISLLLSLFILAHLQNNTQYILTKIITNVIINNCVKT